MRTNDFGYWAYYPAYAQPITVLSHLVVATAEGNQGRQPLRELPYEMSPGQQLTRMHAQC